jgi:hypothetical protein
MSKKWALLLSLSIFAVTSCNAVQNLIHDDVVVAKVGKHKLYRSELRKYIPAGVSSSDSTNLALQYINSWATGQLYSDMAVSQLSKADQDVTSELESYRRSLLRFRYEQQFVNERLDTLITEDQMMSFYKSHQSLFNLERPILKVRFIDIVKTSEQRESLIKKMSSNRPSDVVAVDSLARVFAIKYFDNSQTWMDASTLAKEFGTDYLTMLSQYKNNYITIESSDMADVKVAYVREMKKTGVAPYEFCIDRIREYILSERKRELLVALEQRLLDEASDKGQFVIY